MQLFDTESSFPNWNETALKNASRFMVENKKLFRFVQQNFRYNDEPQMYSYSTSYYLPKPDNDIKFEYASGFSFDKKTALMRMLGESMERYSLDYFYPKIIKTIPMTKLDKKTFLDPHKISPYSKKQLLDEKFQYFRITDTSVFQWCRIKSLVTGKYILFPAQLTCLHFDFLDNEPIILRPTSSGVATGISVEDALYRAILELVEHDSFMIHYLNMLPSPRIDLTTIDDKRIVKILELYKRYNLELYVLDITTDLGIPSFVALTIDRTRIGPAVGIGLKSRFSQIEAILAAVEESAATSTWIRDEYPKIKKKITITTIPHRAYYWYPLKTLDYLHFWLKESKLTSLKVTKPVDQSLNFLVSIFKKKKMDILYLDITHEKVKKNGFSVIRTFIPELHPIYFDERFPLRGNKRLYSVPVSMGYYKNEKTEVDINVIPHPLL